MSGEQKPTFLGVDIGGSHITVSVVCRERGKVLEEFSVREKVNPHDNQEEILNAWLSPLKKLASQFDATTLQIGIAMPGPFDYEAGISLIKGMNKYESLYKVNVKQKFAIELCCNENQISFLNDAKAFLIGEVNAGAGRFANRVIGITLGTGLGTAVSVNSIVNDANLGVSPFKEGIAEDYISTRWFVKKYRELSGKEIKNTKELADCYELDRFAKQIFLEFSINLAVFLDTFIKKENPEVVIIGGNIAKAHSFFLRDTQKQLDDAGHSVQIKISELWEDAAIIGASFCRELPTLTGTKP